MPDTALDDMATLAPDSPALSPPFHRRRKSWARKVERVCCQTISYFPLLFVYGLTSWAVWVLVTVASLSSITWLAYLEAGLGVLLYGLAVVSYTIAVFTDPGSPLDPRRDAGGRRKGGGYEGLPTYEDEESGAMQNMSTVTAKSDGKARYCKKCRTVKPDRSHHCSSCGKCVLKMDHHCPWLATCAGLHNYKPFLLFLSYTSLFCWVCFGVSVSWVWAEIIDDVQMTEGLRVVNTILLAVLGGIIGLVLSGFTGWHIYLATTGQTTIESLEKTRYLSPLRKNMEQQFKSQSNRHYLDQDQDRDRSGSSTPNNNNNNDHQTLTEHLKEIHANALPGVLRPEEGETSLNPSPSNTPAPAAPPLNLRRSYASMEAQREQDRYDAYLDELDSEKLPNAFDMGWQRNLLHVFGASPLLWFLPVCNSTGDGWHWEVSPKWTAARDNVARERAQRLQSQPWESQQQGTTVQSQSQSHPQQQPQAKDLRWQPGQGFVNNARTAPPRATYAARAAEVPMQPLDRRKAVGDSNASTPDAYDTSSDEEQRGVRGVRSQVGNVGGSANWNDIPDDFLAPRGRGIRDRSRSRGRRKGD